MGLTLFLKAVADHRSLHDACTFCRKFGKCQGNCRAGFCGDQSFCWSCGAFEWDEVQFEPCRDLALVGKTSNALAAQHHAPLAVEDEGEKEKARDGLQDH